MNILLIDDNPDDVELFRRSLERSELAASLVHADSLSAAISLLKSADCLVLDLHLPGETPESVLSFASRQRSLPVAIFTAGAPLETVDLAEQSGALCYICKTGLADLAQMLRFAMKLFDRRSQMISDLGNPIAR